MTGWWFVFGMRQIDRLMMLQTESAAEFVRYHRMLMWEGAALFISLWGAALALAYFMYRELRQRGAVDSFLATFTHELKTPIASLRLQAEALREQIEEPEARRLLDRLVGDTGRLTLQLDNCLFLAASGDREILLRELSLKELLESLARQWPDIELTADRDCILRADVRALESILQNLIQNAVSHGKATRVEVSVSEAGNGMMEVSLHDNGSGFSGDRWALGILFRRHYPGSGSGIGLYLAGKLARAMGGEIEFHTAPAGFSATLRLPGHPLFS